MRRKRCRHSGPGRLAGRLGHVSRPIFCRNRDTSSRVEWKELWVSGAAPAPALPRATGGASAAAAQPGHAGKTSRPAVRHPDREEALTEPRPLCGSFLPPHRCFLRKPEWKVAGPPQQHSVPCLPGPVGGRRRGVARHGEPGQALPRFPRLPSPGLAPVTRAHPEILLAVDKGSFQHLKKLLHKESIFLVKKF